MTKIAITLTSKQGETAVVDAYPVGKHWAIAQKFSKEGWALTYVSNGHVDGRGHWDEATAEKLAAQTTVPEALDGDEMPPTSAIRPWADEVLAAGDALALSTASERLGPKLEGLRLYRVVVEQVREAELYVLAETVEKAEAMSRDADVSWGDEEYSESGWEIGAEAVPSYALGDDVIAPRGFPTTSVREVLAALAAQGADVRTTTASTEKATDDGL